MYICNKGNNKTKTIMEKNTVKICSICGKPYVGYGNNAAPINDGRCCDECNRKVVMARMFIDRLINTEVK